MTIQGAICELKELIENETMPFYFKPSLEKVVETIEMELVNSKENNEDDEDD